MSEQIIWKGTPSNISNIFKYFYLNALLISFLFVTFFLSHPVISQVKDLIPNNYFFPAVLSIASLPILIMLKILLTTKTTNYEITSDRLKVSEGILSRTHDEIELYRVKDYSIEQTFIQRIFSLGTISLDTSDTSHPKVFLHAIKNPLSVRDKIRNLVEELRSQKGVREIDH
jgi:uncharacterized membrane protein YdbT with pleckstrin-like domain